MENNIIDLAPINDPNSLINEDLNAIYTALATANTFIKWLKQQIAEKQDKSPATSYSDILKNILQEVIDNKTGQSKVLYERWSNDVVYDCTRPFYDGLKDHYLNYLIERLNDYNETLEKDFLAKHKEYNIYYAIRTIPRALASIISKDFNEFESFNKDGMQGYKISNSEVSFKILKLNSNITTTETNNLKEDFLLDASILIYDLKVGELNSFTSFITSLTNLKEFIKNKKFNDVLDILAVYTPLVTNNDYDLYQLTADFLNKGTSNLPKMAKSSLKR